MKRFPIATAKDRKAFVEQITGSSTFQFQRIDGTQWGIGIMTFEDGWSVQGNSVCVNPADYNETTGIAISTEDCLAKATTHYWRTIGYMAMIGMTEIAYAPK